MGLYLKFFSMHLKSQMEYRVSFFLTVFGQFLVPFTVFLGIYFMFTRFESVAGFNFEQVLMCYATLLMAFSLAEILGRGFDTFPTMLGNGELDRALVRPRSLVFLVLAGRMDFTRLGRLFQAVVVLCYAIPNSGIHWTITKALTVFLMIGCGSLVFFGLFLVYAAFSFFTVEGLEFMNILTDGGREFGRYPFAIYGKKILLFLTFIVPLALFQYYPLLYLLDMEQNPLYMLMPLISLLFLVPSYAFFRFGLRHYKSTGS